MEKPTLKESKALLGLTLLLVACCERSVSLEGRTGWRMSSTCSKPSGSDLHVTRIMCVVRF